MTRKVGSCRVEVSPSEVDAGANMTLQGKVDCSPAEDLRGTTLLIKDQDGTLAQSLELTKFDGETNETNECAIKAPVEPGVYTWLAEYPAHSKAGTSSRATSAPFSFNVRPHHTRVVVWDVPSAIECGEKFSVMLGVKCSSECRPDGWAIEIRDHEGKTRATTTLSDDPWPGTAALHYAVIDLSAPDTEGPYTWEARTPVGDLDVAHAECVTSFAFRVEPTPEHVLTVVAMDGESQTPVKGVKVVVHPYHAFTDERGVAELRVPKGEYRLFVSGRSYAPFRRDVDVTADATITAELALDRGLSDADIWS